MTAVEGSGFQLGPYEWLRIFWAPTALAALMIAGIVTGFRLVYFVGAFFLAFVGLSCFQVVVAFYQDAILEESYSWLPLLASTRRDLFRIWLLMVACVVALAGLAAFHDPSFPMIPVMALAGAAGASIPWFLWIDLGRRRQLALDVEGALHREHCFVNEDSAGGWFVIAILWFTASFMVSWPIGVALRLNGFGGSTTPAGDLMMVLMVVALVGMAIAFTKSFVSGSEIRPVETGFRMPYACKRLLVAPEVVLDRVANCYETTVGAFSARVLRVEFIDGSVADFWIDRLEDYEDANGLNFPAWMLATFGSSRGQRALGIGIG